MPPLPPSPGAVEDFFPPDYFPPANATPFLVQGSTTGLAAGTTLTLGAFTLPASEQGVVRSIVVGCDNLAITSDVRFSVRINGAAVPGYGDIRFPPQPAAFASFAFAPEETRLWVVQGALLELVVRAVVGGPYAPNGTLHGWHWGTA